MIAAILLLIANTGNVSAGDVDRAISVLADAQRAIVVVDYDGESVGGMIRDLQSQSGLALIADWEALDRMRLDADRRVNLRLGSVSLWTALHGLAGSLHGPLGMPHVEIHEGLIVFTTREARVRMRLSAMYDVRDILTDIALISGLLDEHFKDDAGETDPEEPGATDDADVGQSPATEHHAAQNPGTDGIDRGDEADNGLLQVRADKPDVDDDVRTDDPPADDHNDLPRPVLPPNISFDDITLDDAQPIRPIDELVYLLTEHIEPDSWNIYGGEVALIEAYEGHLLITAPATIHRRVRQLLGEIRAASPRGITLDVALIEIEQDRFDFLTRRFDRSATGLATALLDDEDSRVTARVSTPIDLGEAIEYDRHMGEFERRFSVQPRIDGETGLLVLSVRYESAGDAGRTTLNTTTSIPLRGGAAVVDLDTASHGSHECSLRTVMVLMPTSVGLAPAVP